MLDTIESLLLQSKDHLNDLLLLSCFGLVMLPLLPFGAGAAVPCAWLLAGQFAVGLGVSAAYSVVAVLNGHNPAEVLERH